MRSRILSLALGWLAILGCQGASLHAPVAALPEKTPGRYQEQLPHDGLTRSFLLDVPKAYDASRRLPLVVLLHGWMGNARTIAAYSGFQALAEKQGFVLATPEGLGNPQGWNAGFLDLSGKNRPDDVGFVAKMLDQVENEVGIDPERVFVVGHSNGAMLAHYVAAKLSDRIAAIGAVAGTVGLPGQRGAADSTIPTPTSPVSVILLHGNADRVVTYDKDHPGLLRSIGAPDSAKWWATRNGCSVVPSKSEPEAGRIFQTYAKGKNGCEVTLVTFDKGSHDWPSGGADIIWKFLTDHPRAAR